MKLHYVLAYSGTGQVKQTIHKVMGTAGKDGHLTVGLHDMRPPARWAGTRSEIETKWRTAIERERAVLAARLAELDAMTNAGPIFQES